MKSVQLSGSLNILWRCPSLGLEWKLTFSSPMATADFFQICWHFECSLFFRNSILALMLIKTPPSTAICGASVQWQHIDQNMGTFWQPGKGLADRVPRTGPGRVLLTRMSCTSPKRGSLPLPWLQLSQRSTLIRAVKWKSSVPLKRPKTFWNCDFISAKEPRCDLNLWFPWSKDNSRELGVA